MDEVDRGPGYNVNGVVVYTLEEAKEEAKKQQSYRKQTYKGTTVSSAITEVQKEQLDKICEKFGITSSEFIRTMIVATYKKEFEN